MSSLVVLPASTPANYQEIHSVGMAMREFPQVPFITDHKLHGGTYTRTVMLPNGTRFAGVLVKVASTLVIVGDVTVYANGMKYEFSGVNVLCGKANRIQAFIANSVCVLIMQCRCDAKTIEDAQKHFTDEYELLHPLSDTAAHTITITGE